MPTSTNPISGIGTSHGIGDSIQNYMAKSETISKVIKIPWKMYKFVNSIGDRKKSVKNAMIVGESIRQWWNSSIDFEGRIKLKSLNDVYMIYMNLIIENIPLLEKNSKNCFVQKIAILPIVTFEPKNLPDVEDNDFVFGGIMKISKTDPEEIISLVIDGVDVVAGKYQLKE